MMKNPESGQSNQYSRAQIIYFSHGGGPLPVLGDAGHKSMVDFMVHLPDQLRKPDAIIVISAHWEENTASLLAAQKPPLFYDYYGFPPSAYSLKYPVSGFPGLAKRVVELLNKNDMPARLEFERGFDHGLFIPMKLMYPQADIASIQLSLIRGLNPKEHITLGKALQELMPENIMVIGSGFSFHNMQEFSWRGINKPDPQNDSFQNWLIEVCCGSLSQSEREQRLIEWQKAPSALYCHPREEHLLPRHVCLGMAAKKAELIFDDYILGKRAVAFQW